MEMLFFMLVPGVITALIAHHKGRNVAGWFLIGFLLGIIGIIIAAVMPNLATQQAEKQRIEMENRRLREQLYQERVKSEAFRQHTTARLDTHDRQIGVDTRDAHALPAGDDPPHLLDGPAQAHQHPSPAAADPPGLWYYENGGHVHGPITTPALMQMVAHAQITDDTLVWTEAMSDWTAARDVPEIQRHLA